MHAGVIFFAGYVLAAAALVAIAVLASSGIGEGLLLVGGIAGIHLLAPDRQRTRRDDHSLPLDRYDVPQQRT